MNQIPMLDLHAEYEYMKPAIDNAIQTCLKHQMWILGPEVKALEGALAAYLGVKHCIGVSSGTEALVLSLRALAIARKDREYFERGELVITTPFTFTATGDAILRSGATPVFVDIDPVTYNLDPAGIRSCIKEHGAKIVGIVPVHLYGQSCDMDAIMNIATEHKLFVLEDVAQAFGAAWRGTKLGAVGTLGAFSFFPSKNLGGFGDGGMISTNDDDLAAMARMLLKHGGRDKYNVDHIGYNARLDTLQAAVLLAKFKYIDEFNDRRRGIAEQYLAGLQGTAGLVLPQTASNARHVFHQFTIASARRDDLQKHLTGQGVSSMLYYPFPLHKMKVFEGRSLVHRGVPKAEAACAQVLSLPVEPLQSAADTQRVVAATKEFAR